MKATTPAAAFFDQLRRDHSIKNDSQLATVLGVTRAHISHIRKGKAAVSAGIILGVHEYLGIPVADIRSALSQGGAV